MILHGELYFEITLEGSREALKKFESYAMSGVFSDFFDVLDDYLIYDDDFATDETGRLIFTNDEYGIEIARFKTDDFLELLCSGAKDLDVTGSLYDIDDDEFRFVSPMGDYDYTDQDNVKLFNDELDAAALEEEERADSDSEDEDN